MKVCVIMATGFEDVEALGTIDLLRRAKVEVDVYGLESRIVSSSGMTYDNLLSLDNLKEEEYELLFIPGGLKNTELLGNNDKVKEFIKYFVKDKKMAAICAAPTILGELGLLKGKNYTCYTGMQKDEYQGTYLNQYYVIDGNILTARSMSASIEFGLAIVEFLLGKEAAKEVKERIIY